MEGKVEYHLVPVNNIFFNQISSRQLYVGKNLDVLAKSIELHGLFSPVLLVEGLDEKYELLAGLRRVLAYREILAKNDPGKFSSIPAFVYPDMEEWKKKAISTNANFTHEQVTDADKIGASTACFCAFGSIKTASEKTGLSHGVLRKYVKYERLPPALQELMDGGKIKLRTAMEVADLYGFDSSGTQGIPDAEIEAVANDLAKLSIIQKDIVRSILREEKSKSVPDAVKIAGEKEWSSVEVKIQVTEDSYDKICSLMRACNHPSIDMTVADILEEALESRCSWIP
ncbi:hypothetical protein IBTHAUMO2_880018 [Nitrosopumilaceae archaeon]|nr:hypothetical protein IBTHAUMO2_880018 [Nitrosopumilaceae archaeon]